MFFHISAPRAFVWTACIVSIFSGIGCVAVSAQAQLTAPANPIAKGVTLTLTSSQAHYSAQEPVIVDLHVINESDQPVNYADVNSPLESQVFTLTDTAGGLVPLTTYGRQLLKLNLAKLNHNFPQAGRRLTHVNLLPGQQATYHVWLNRVFDLSAEGDYVISATKPVSDGTSDLHSVTANPLKITITSSNAAPYSERGFPDEAPSLERRGSSPNPNHPLLPDFTQAH